MYLAFNFVEARNQITGVNVYCNSKGEFRGFDYLNVVVTATIISC